MKNKLPGILISVLVLVALLINVPSVVFAATSLRITKQPVSAVAESGDTAKVTLSAVGDGLTYKWYFKNEGDSKFSLTTSFKSNSYSVKMNDSRNGRQLYCVVKDKHGNSVKTKTVTLNMGTPLKITSQPVSVTAKSGSTAKVTVKAAGDGLTYRWYFKNKGDSKFSLTTSFKSNSYSVKMNDSRNGRQLYCVVKDKYGNSVKTKTVTLNMGTPLKITSQPVSVTAKSGSTAKATVKAAGDGLTYKWYFKNKGDSKFSLTTSFKGNSYSVKMNDSRNGRQLYCVVKDKYGNSVKTKTVTLNMGTPLKITSQPASTKANCGSTAKVTVKATGDGLTYKWYFKNKGDSKFSLTTSFKGNSYSVKMNDSRSGRQLYCVIKDKYGNSITTKTVTLTINHVYDNGKVIKKATCTKVGEKLYTCEVCSKTVTKTSSALGHNLGEWKVIREATVTTTGVERASCSRCSYYKDRSLEKLKAVYYITINTGDGKSSRVGVAANGKYNLDNPHRAGYVFMGWKDKKGKDFSSSGKISANVEIDAVWATDGTDTLDELIERTEAGLDRIVITGNISVTEPIFISYDTTIYSDGDYTIMRAPDYDGDIFVVGKNQKGQSAAVLGRKAILTLGGGKGTLTIDGNKDNITTVVKGSLVFVSDSATLNLYDGVCITNNKKLSNDRIFDYTSLVSAATLERAGGAGVLNFNATVNMYGGVISNNEVFTEDTIITNDDGTETWKDTNGCGGGIYNRGNFNMYGGKIADNEGLRGGGMYNDRIIYLTSGTICDNIAHSYGGAISSSSTSNAEMYIGSEGDGNIMLFDGNHSTRAGGALYSNTCSPIIIYGNTEFKNNHSDSSGGAIYTAGSLTVEGTKFSGNYCEYSGGAIYHHYSNPDYTRRLFKLTDCVLEGNKAGLGGAVILSAASAVSGTGTSATITDCDFTGNQAVLTSTNPGNGGAIYITRNSEATIKGCSFDENTAANNAGAIAIHSSSKVKLPDCTFVGNSAVYGGAMYVSSQAVVNMSDLEFTDNSAVYNTSGGGGNGGALYTYDATVTLKNVDLHNNSADNHAGGLYQGACDLTLDSTCEFTGNSAGKHGGAIYITYKSNADGTKDGSVLNVTGVTFENNSALSGGAISARSASELNLTDVNFIKNTTPNAVVGSGDGGGAVYSNNSTLNIQNVTFKQNASGYYGGALKADTCEVVLENSDLIDNEGGTGGAIYATGGTFTANSLTAPDNTSSVNGVIYLSGSVKATFTDFTASGNKAGSGGVLYASSKSQLTVKNSSFADNSANNGGTLYAAGNSSVEILDSKLNNNQATKGNGGAVYVVEATFSVNGETEFNNNTSSNRGGAFYIEGGKLDLTRGTIVLNNNSALYGGAVCGVSADLDLYNVTMQNNGTKDGNVVAVNGGAIYAASTTVDITGVSTIISGNAASEHGGAIYVSYITDEEGQKVGGVLNIIDASVCGNQALYGGAISGRTNSDITLKNVILSQNNTANATTEQGGGGAVYTNNSKLTLLGTTVSDNSSGYYGGAIYTEVTEVVLKDSTLLKNNRGGTGGALYLTASSSLTAEDLTITKNISTANGVVYLNGKNFEFTNLTACENSTSWNGGVFYINGAKSEVTVDGATISDNSASSGGAVALMNGSLTLNNALITNNKATHDGGAIMAQVGCVTILDGCNLSYNEAGADGGAIMAANEAQIIIKNAPIENNVATTNGGAINIEGASLDISGSVSLFNNTATTNGGAVYINDYVPVDENTEENTRVKASVTINGAVFEGNSARRGGAVYVGKNNYTLNNVQFLNNTATEDTYGGGAVYTTDSIGQLNNIVMSGNSSVKGGAVALHTNSQMTVTALNAVNNIAHANSTGSLGVGGVFYVNNSILNLTANDASIVLGNTENANSAVSGGVLFAENGATVDISGAKIIGNTATGNGGAIYIHSSELNADNMQLQNNTAGINGGAMYLTGTKFTGEDNEFISNTASGHGGAVYVSYTGQGENRIVSVVNLTGGVFENNTAMAGGAASIRSSCEATFDSTEFKGNSVAGYANEDDGDGEGGGAIYVGFGKLNLDNVTASGNIASGFGGVVDAVGATVNVSGGTYSENQANNGGAFYAISNSKLTFNGSTLVANESVYVNTNNNNDIGGGAVSVVGGSLTMKGTTLDRNKTGYYGGALLANGSVVIIDDNSTVKNSEGTTGAALFFKGNCTVTIANTAITNNTAKSNGVIYANNSKIELDNVTASGNNAVNGGVIYTSNANSKITVKDSEFTQNTAKNGGVLYADAATVELNDCLLSQNSATVGGTIHSNNANIVLKDGTFTDNTSTQSGGAIRTQGGTLEVRGTVFSGNKATNHGGAAYLYDGVVTFEDATFTANTAGVNGGAIDIVGATVTVSGDSSFSDNIATNHGGAIYITYIDATETTQAVGGNLTMTGGTFQNNMALGGGAVSIRSSCEATFDGTEFNGNSVTGYADEDDGDGEGGGAIYVGFGTLNLNNVKASGNTATGFGGVVDAVGATVNVSGGTYSENNANSGGAVLATDATVTINGNSVIKNSEGATGAALYFRGSSKVTIENTTISGNTSKSNGVIYLGGGTLNITAVTATENTSTNGGVLYVSGGSTKVTIKNSEWNNNSATYGGAIYIKGANVTVENSEIKQNTAQLGGAVYNANGILTIVDTDFIANTAIANSEGKNGNGGAITLSGGELIATGDNTFSDNEAANHGGAVYVAYSTNDDGSRTPGVMTMTGGVFENNKAIAGGAISSRTDCEVTLTGTVLKGNSASGTASDVGGGAIFTNNNTLVLSGVTLDGNSTGYYGGAITALGATVDIKDNSVIKNNVGITGVAFNFRNGGTCTLTDIFVTDNIANGTGSGVIYITNNGTLNISNLTASGNKNNNGGVIYTSGSAVVSITDSNLTGNTALSFGGAIDHRSSGALTVNSTTISNNTAKNGGAINTAGSGTVIVENSNIIGNKASEFGGAIYHGASGKLNIIATTISDNSAAKNGGAIYAVGKGLITVSNNSNFNTNTALSAGAIYLDQGASAQISDSTFDGNTATGGDGGAIVVADSSTEGTAETTLIMTNVTLKNNTASAKGGAISTDTASPNLIINVTGCAFSNNSALGAGGGAVEIQNGNSASASDPTELKIVFTNCSFTGNTAKTTGGAIEIRTNSCAYVDGITANNNRSTDNGGVIYVTSNYSRLYLSGTVNIGGNTAKSGTFIYLYNNNYTNPPKIYTAHSSTADWYSEVAGNKTSIVFDLVAIP